MSAIDPIMDIIQEYRSIRYKPGMLSAIRCRLIAILDPIETELRSCLDKRDALRERWRRNFNDCIIHLPGVTVWQVDDMKWCWASGPNVRIPVDGEVTGDVNAAIDAALTAKRNALRALLPEFEAMGEFDKDPDNEFERGWQAAIGDMVGTMKQALEAAGGAKHEPG